MKWKNLAALPLVASLLVPMVASAQQNGTAPRTTNNAAARGDAGALLPPINHTTFKLANGLEVILHPDRSTPIVAVNVWYHVGSKNEVPGRTGSAHLFEHMMFQGSKNYDDDYFKPLQEAGANINGSTNNDRTNYFEVVPSNFLELALFMEADRMGGLLEAMTEEKLANQRFVVKNEKRQRIDNQPYGLAFEKIAATMYPPNHPYHWTVIGSLEDLTNASMEDVKAFFRRYYVPNNASLTIAGDFDSAEARRLVEKYFSAIERGGEVPRPNPPQPKIDREIRMQEEDRVSLPRVYMTWHSTPQMTPDDAPLDMLASVLAEGKGSRLYKTLVYDRQIAQEVSAFHGSREIAGTFSIVATAKPGKTLAELEEAINQEIAKITSQPPSREEMERAYTEREASFVYGLQTVLAKADQMNQYNTYVGQPDHFRADLARYAKVAAADVQRVAAKYLTDKRMILSIVPRGQEKKTGEPAPAGPKSVTAPTQQATGASATQTAAPPTSGAAGQPAGQTASQTGERPAGVRPQTKAEASATTPGGASPPVAGAPAAQGETKEKNVDTSKLPKPKPDPAQLTLPAVQRRQLSNGLEVLIVEHHELPVVNMNLVVKAGGAADASERAGVASVTAGMLDEGTRTRSALDISNQLSAVGASLFTNSNWDASSASLQTLTRNLDRALDIFADVVTNPAFPEGEIQRQRQSRLTALRQRRDNANAIASVVYPALLYGRTHPYGHPLLGDEKSVTAINAGDVRKFYETYYRPNNAALIVVGDVKPDTLVPQLERALGNWKKADVPAIDVSAAPVERRQPTIYLVDRPGAAQSVLSIGHVGVPRATPDYFSLLALNRLLGGQFVSRVNLNLRENKGYTYGARTVFDYRRGAGPFAASADVQTAVTKESIAEFLKELRGVRGDMPVTAAELEYAKQSIIRSFPTGFETPAQIAARLEDIVLYNLPDDYFNNYLARVRAVSLDDVTRAANRYLDPSRLAILVVGDRREIEPGLRSLSEIGGTLVVIDAEGNPVSAAGESGGGTR
ncbi:MAG: insulinase family protein [Acidobacteriota bacterium]|nr:insulinase family protein [Acidobacteriota bacterium]